MKILDMERPIASDAIYTRVNILERLTGRRRKSLAELKAEFQLEDFGRFGMAEPIEKRLDAEEAASNHRRLLLLGRPGAGKTTFLKRLAIRCCNLDFRGDLAPAYIELKGLDHSTVETQLSKLWNVDPWPLIEGGRALLLLDGMDEVPDVRFSALRVEIEQLAERAGTSLILLTSRIAARDYVFPQFTEVEVADFGPAEVRGFAALWFQSRGTPEKAEAFITRLAENPSILELAHNPLLLTMMCLLFEGRTDFDGNRAELYEEAIAVLLKKWDAKRSIVRDRPYEQLTINRRQDLLCFIARERFERNEYLFEKRSLENQVRDYFGRYGHADDLDAEVIVRAMEAQHGLLVERANEIYSFSHLTFQEYFTARSFVRGSGDRWAGLLRHVTERRWREVFLLVVSMVEPEEILIRMEWALDKMLQPSLAIQQLLEWSKLKATAPSKRYTSSACRAFYCYLASLFYECEQFESEYGGNKKEPGIRIGLDLAIELDYELRHDVDPDLDLDLALGRAYFTGGHGRVTDTGWDRDEREVSMQLAHALSLSRTLRLPDSFVDQLQQLWQRVYDGYDVDLRALRLASIQYRNIGHAFPFAPEDVTRLNKVYDGYRLLTNSVNTSRVATDTRKYIESTLLLPSADVAQRSLPQGVKLARRRSL